LLDALSRHQPFERMLLTYYSGKFGSMTALDEAFRDYAANELAIAEASDPAD
jgi:hypothetical protein